MTRGVGTALSSAPHLAPQPINSLDSRPAPFRFCCGATLLTATPLSPLKEVKSKHPGQALAVAQLCKRATPGERETKSPRVMAGRFGAANSLSLSSDWY